MLNLTRDGCATLSCQHGAVCANSSCSCPRYTTTDGLSYGWAGLDCSVPDCPGTPDCGARGVCMISGVTNLPVCSCNSLYNGTSCQTSLSGASTYANPADATSLVPAFGPGFSANNSIGYSTKSGVALIGKTVRVGLDVRQTHLASFRFPTAMSALVRLEVDGSPLADPILMGRANQPPTLTDYDSFDVSSWTSSASTHVYAAIVTPGDYYISVLNSRYGESPLNFTLYYEFATLCPPSLSDSSNITSPYSYPGGSGATACSGHGDPAAYCSNPSVGAVPPSTPVLCSCVSGWEGVYCDVEVPTVSDGVPFVASGLQPGDWKYFVFPANSSTVEINVNATRTSASLRSQPLVVVGRTSARTPQSLSSLFDSNLYDFDGYTASSGVQSLRISRTTTLSVRPMTEYFYIGVHNTKNAKAALDMSVTLSALTQFSARCPASSGVATQSECMSAASASVCGGNGQAILNAEDSDAVDCQCGSGWNRRSYCGSPLVFQTFGEFLSATQSINFLCSVCSVEIAATSQSVSFYRIPQPLQKATALSVLTNQSSLAANPSLMIAQVCLCLPCCCC